MHHIQLLTRMYCLQSFLLILGKFFLQFTGLQFLFQEWIHQMTPEFRYLLYIIIYS